MNRRFLGQRANRFLDDARCRSAPSGVDSGRSAPFGVGEKDGHAIRSLDRQCDAADRSYSRIPGHSDSRNGRVRNIDDNIRVNLT